MDSSARGATDRIFARTQDTRNAGDVQAYSQVYAEDASYVNCSGVLHLGREEIRPDPWCGLGERFSGHKVADDSAVFLRLCPDNRRRSCYGAAITASTGSQQIRAMVTIVLSNKSGEWQVVALHVSDIQAEP